MSSKGPKRRSMRNQPRLYEHHSKALATINNLYIEAGTIVRALSTIKDNQNLGSEEFRVPSTKGKSELIRRSPGALHDLIQSAMTRREYEKSIVLLISLAEDYLVSYARLLSRAYPERLEPQLVTQAHAVLAGRGSLAGR